ncbi:unnamed protein product [Camellia sinensis]
MGTRSELVIPHVCQVHQCNKDLSSSKSYHKRHKVCDVQSKTARVIVNSVAVTGSRHRPPPSPNRLLPSVREQHNAGYKHKANARTYYQQFEAQQNQSLIHQKIKEHLGQTTAYQQVGAAYNALRPRVPILPTPMMPMAGNTQLPVNSPLIPGARPPVLPRPLPGWHVRCTTSAVSGRKEEILKCGKGSNDLERIERGANEVICLHQ